MAKELVKKGRKTVVVDNNEKPAVEKQGEADQPAAKKEKSAAELLDERVLAQMKTLHKNGIKECTSTLLRDKLSLDKESGRGKIRRAMKRLAKDGKVVISEKTAGKRKQYVFKLKEP